MSETFNVRDRSFIKVPEVKCCTACGQPLSPEVKPMSNHMNKYMSVEGRVVVQNSNEDILEVKQGDITVSLYKVTGKDKNGKDVSSFIPVPKIETTILSSVPLTAVPLTAVVNQPTK
jgi:hypothetical protein